MSKKTKTILAVVLLLVVVAAAVCAYFLWGPPAQKRAAEADAGKTHITFVVVHGDKSTKEFAISTDKTTLREALEQEGLIAGTESDWGLWGHQLARVLGTNDDTTYGFQNMDEELFAHSGSMTYKDQFCFSSEKLYDLTVRYILDQYGDGSRTPSRITIGPNDNTIVCMCPRCQGIGNTARNATPAVTQFVEKLAKRFPKHHFFIPAYLTTGLPPAKPLPDNVGVFLSAIDYPRAWDNLDSPAARHFFDLMEQWKKVCKTIYVWDYICNFDDYITAYPILSVMQQRIQEYRRRGVKGIFLNGSGYFYSCLQEHFTFILANMLIDPDLDIDEELRTYYQDAMPHIGIGRRHRQAVDDALHVAVVRVDLLVKTEDMLVHLVFPRLVEDAQHLV